MSNALSPGALSLGKSLQWFTKATCTSLLLFTVSCTHSRSSPVDLTLKVEPSNRPGVYTVSGSTNVPDQSQIMVQGIRPLTAAPQSADKEKPPNYAILDRQAAVVSQGRWQVTLNLWQSTPDGQYQEAWQSDQRQLRQLRPSPEIIFLAAIDPGNQSKALKQQLERQGKTLEGAKIRFTTDEQWHLQAKQTIALPPPIVKQSASASKAKDSDTTLASRSEATTLTATRIPTNLPVSKEAQATAPLAFSQRFR